MTNKTISLTIPNDDPIALHEFGAAMQRMAGRHGLEVPQAVVQRETHTAGDVERVLVDSDKAQLAALGEAVEIVKAAAPVLLDDKFRYEGEEVSGPRAETTQSHLDSDGLPWDARIHASSKERNADDTWRARRKPSDMDAGQWAEFQGQVRTELRALMELPVEPEVAAVLDEPIADTVVVYYTDGDDGIGYKHVVQGKSVEQALDEVYEISDIAVITKIYLNNELQPLPTPVVVEPVEPEPIVVTPPPVVAPPAPVDPVTPVAPPAPTGTAPTEFVPFLQWITSSGITPEQVNVALVQHGLTAVPQLQQRPDLIPQVHATLAAGV